MKILVVNNMAPFIRGGAEELADHLVRNLTAFGHQAELVRIPFSWEPAEHLLEELLLNQGLRIKRVDRVIALKFPAYLIPFDQKVLWLLHQFRQAYDLWDAGQSNIPDTPRGLEIRNAIRRADNQCFLESKKIFVNSAVTRDRLAHYNGFDSEILMPPLNDPEKFRSETQGDYIFAGGRINDTKRQYLLVKAMQYVTSSVKLIIGGPVDSAGDHQRLVDLIDQYGLQDRVRLDIGFLDRSVYADYMNGSLACAYLPFDEDSVGYVTMEACQAAKPIVTVNDSGGLLQLVIEGETGFVCEPDPRSLADRLDRLYLNRKEAKLLGMAAKAKWDSLRITWERTVERLTE